MAVNNSLVKKTAKVGLTAYLTQDAVKKQINSVVGGKNGTRFISSIVSAVQTTPALQECTNPSILSAALLGEALNLSPSPQLGQFYMVPFDNKKKGCKEAQFQLGYKGYIQLAERSGYSQKVEMEHASIHPQQEKRLVSMTDLYWTQHTTILPHPVIQVLEPHTTIYRHIRLSWYGSVRHRKEKAHGINRNFI